MATDDVSDHPPLPRLPPRASESHKGDYGRVLCVGGSIGMSGAISITGLSALRSGAGLVSVATTQSALSTVASFSPCYTTVPLAEDGQGVIDEANLADLLDAHDQYDAWAVGPGLGRSAGVAGLVCELYRAVGRPMVVDADGLNGLAEALGRDPRAIENPGGARILTPHPGEFARMTRGGVATSHDERIAQASALAQRDPSGNTIVVLKGHRTVVADGQRTAVNGTGNPGMATGGAGDCLTGVIAALVAQGLCPWDAARLGVHVHGAAGDRAAEELGQVSLIATDIAACLPAAFRQLDS